MNDCKHYFFLNDFNIANISKSRCKYSEWIATIAAAASFTLILVTGTWLPISNADISARLIHNTFQIGNS